MVSFFDPFGIDEPQQQQRSRPTFNAKDKEFLYERQKGLCNGCESKFPMRNLTVDHIKPFSKGGSDKPSNLQLLCGSCNSTKGNGTQAQMKKRLKEQGVISSPAKAKSSSAPKTKPAVKAKTAQSKAKGKTATKPKASAKRPAKKAPSDPFEELANLFG